MYDWDHIEQLLRIAELTRGRPDLKAIQDAAHAELASIANPPIETSDDSEADEAESDGDSDE